MSNNRRRRAPAQRPPVSTNGHPIDLDAGPDEFAEREPLFVAGGKTYTIPVRVSAGIALQWLEIASIQGDTAAMVWALNWALGDEGYLVLRGHRTVSDDHYATIIRAVRAKFVSAQERTGPKARTGM